MAATKKKGAKRSKKVESSAEPALPQPDVHKIGRLKPLTDIAQATSKVDSRYSISSVYHEGDGRLVATDGRMLAIAPAEAADVPVGMVPRSMVERGKEATVNGMWRREIKYRKMRAVIEDTTPQGAMPPYQEVFPKPKEIEGRKWIALNASLLHRLAQSISEDGQGLVMLGIGEANKPIAVMAMGDVSDRERRGFGLLMPATPDTIPDGAKEWNRCVESLKAKK